MKVYVQTYNILSKKMSNPSYFIHHDPKYIDWKYRTSAICEKILDSNLESKFDIDNNDVKLRVYCLQEVHKDQSNIIMEKLKLEFNFHYKSYSGSMGVMILWNKSAGLDDKVITHEYVYDIFRGNCAIGVTFSSFSIWNVHLPCMYNVENACTFRTELMKDIIGKIQQETNSSPLILVGDFNSSPSSSTYTYLSSIMKSAYRSFHGDEPIYTNIFTGNNGISSFNICDYIFTDKKMIEIDSINKAEYIDNIELENTIEEELSNPFIIPNKNYLSDHIPVSGIFSININD